MTVTTGRAGGAPAPAPDGTAVRSTAVGSAAVLTSVGAVVALHVLRPNLGPAGHRLSEYAVGPWGWLMTAAFLGFTGGLLAVRRGLPAHGRLGPVRALLGVGAVGMVVSAVFETDVTAPHAAREVIHSTASSGAFLSLVAAAVWTVTGARAVLAWPTPTVVPDGIVTLAVLGAVVSPLAHDGPWTGAVQRASYVVLVIWLLLLSRARPVAAPPPRHRRRRPPRRSPLTRLIRSLRRHLSRPRRGGA